MELAGFDLAQAIGITGLSERQLRYWSKTGFFSPEFRRAERATIVYSFRDLVGLRAIAALRKRGVSLQELRKLARWLGARYETPWSALRFFVAGRRVYFSDPTTDVRLASQPLGQAAMAEIWRMDEIASDTRNAVDAAKRRRPEAIGRISRSRRIARGVPVFDGTRVPVAAVLDLHRSGMTIEEILSEYPLLKAEDVEAAVGSLNSRTAEQ